MEHKSVLLDTSFFIRLLNDKDPLHHHAKKYFQYFLTNQYILKCSTISIAEYCVKGELFELPLRNLQILPFNIPHATQTGKFAAIVFKEKGKLGLPDRTIIPNDTKLFAQAHAENTIHHFATSDKNCIKVYDTIKQHQQVDFDIINIRKPHTETFGLLDL